MRGEGVMTRDEVIACCLTFPDAAADAPFDNDAVVIRRRSNRRWFALLLTVDGRDAVNLKCEPRRAELYRGVYQDVLPGWHMNKTHWNTVRLDGDVPDEELREMIGHSHELTAPAAAPRKPRLQGPAATGLETDIR